MTAAVAITTAERAAKRREIRDRCLARAEVEARRLAFSVTCFDGRHDGCVEHLRVNGGTCCCPHHDETGEGTNG